MHATSWTKNSQKSVRKVGGEDEKRTRQVWRVNDSSGKANEGRCSLQMRGEAQNPAVRPLLIQLSSQGTCCGNEATFLLIMTSVWNGKQSCVTHEDTSNTMSSFFIKCQGENTVNSITTTTSPWQGYKGFKIFTVKSALCTGHNRRVDTLFQEE